MTDAKETLAALEYAVEALEEEMDRRGEGWTPLDWQCGNCEGAIPVQHSMGCRLRSVVSRLRKEVAP